MKCNKHVNCLYSLYNDYNYLFNMYKPQQYSVLWHSPPKVMIIKGRRILLKSTFLYLIVYLFYLCFIVFNKLLKNGSMRLILTISCTIARCILIVPFVATGSIVSGPSLGADNLHCIPGLRNSMQSPTLYLCFNLVRFSRLLYFSIFFLLIYF
jgi:hypothetical protein